MSDFTDVTGPNLNEKDLDRELREARKRAEIAQINRTSRLRAWNEVISFVTRKISAAGLLVVGSSEILSPDLLSAIQMNDVESMTAIAAGLGILGGKQLSDALNRFYGAKDDL